MSYELSFWRYKPGIHLDHQAVYEALSEGKEIDGLEDLPVEEIRKRIAETFAKGWVQLDDDSWESENTAFQIYTTSRFFRIDCYGLEHNDMNKIADVLSEFDCPLYDPQIGERFDDD